MNFTRFFVAAPIVLATMVAPNLTASSQAKPFAEAMISKHHLPKTTMTGYISDVNGSYDIPCTALKVDLIEHRQTGEQLPGMLFPPYKETVLARSTGVIIEGTCQYKMQFRQRPETIAQYTNLRSYIVRVSGGRYQGSHSYDSFEPIPDGHVFSVVAAPEPILR
jgi:hypothetical protein